MQAALPLCPSPRYVFAGCQPPFGLPALVPLPPPQRCDDDRPPVRCAPLTASARGKAIAVGEAWAEVTPFVSVPSANWGPVLASGSLAQVGGASAPPGSVLEAVVARSASDADAAAHADRLVVPLGAHGAGPLALPVHAVIESCCPVALFARFASTDRTQPSPPVFAASLFLIGGA